MPDCIFCKIVNGDIPKEFTYQDEDSVVFPDIYPMKPIHLLVIPKEHVSELVAVSEPVLFHTLFSVVNKMIVQHNLDKKGYRITINGGGAQVVDHLHIHITGPMGKTAKM